jgi:hypothetical protein
MSEELVTFLLSELATIRLRCKGTREGAPCGAIIEVPLARFKGFFGKGDVACRYCSQSFQLKGSGNSVLDPLGNFAAALERLAHLSGSSGKSLNGG